MPASLLPPYFFQADAVPRNVFNIPPGGVCAAVIHKDSPAGTTHRSTKLAHLHAYIYIKRERASKCTDGGHGKVGKGGGIGASHEERDTSSVHNAHRSVTRRALTMVRLLLMLTPALQ